MNTHVEFRSNRFHPYEGEEQQINPGRYGKRLAEFLSGGLRRAGFEPMELIAEDWGWVIPIRNEGFRLWIGCCNYDEHSDGFLCFIEPHKPVIRRFLWKIETRDRIESLQRAMDKVLSEEPGIREKRWWTYDKFMRPSV